jgi:hypothetical protein
MGVERDAAVFAVAGSFADDVEDPRPKAVGSLLVNRLTVPLESFP